MAPVKKKVTLYIQSTVLDETQREAVRQDRSISWIIQAAWRLARDDVKKLPGAMPHTGGAQASPSPRALRGGIGPRRVTG